MDPIKHPIPGRSLKEMREAGSIGWGFGPDREYFGPVGSHEGVGFYGVDDIGIPGPSLEFRDGKYYLPQFKIDP